MSISNNFNKEKPDGTFENTGFMIDSIMADISNDANHRCIEIGESYYTGAMLERDINPETGDFTLPQNQILPTQAALDAIGKLITGSSITDVVPRDPFTNVGVLSAGTGGEDYIDDVTDLIAAIKYPITNSGQRTPGGYNPVGAPTPQEISLASNLLASKDNIQDRVDLYIDEKKYLDNIVDSELYKAKSRRDIGYMIDAMVNDLTYGVTAKSVQYAVTYWDSDSQRLLDTFIPNYQDNTIDVINKLKTSMLRIAVNNTSNLINSAYKKVDNLISAMVFPLENNGNVVAYQPPGLVVKEKVDAATLIRLNRVNLQDIVTQYVVSNGYLLSNSDELSKCRRDVGFMLDSVAHDLETGVFAKSIQYAVAYWDGSTTRLPENLIPNQRINTINTINYLRARTLGVLGEQSGILGEIANLIDVMTYPLENFGQNLPYFPRQNPSNEDLLAANILQQNKSNLQNLTIQYVDTLNIIRGRPDLQAKCYRDIGYMVDSVIDDLRNGVNSKTIQFALAYYDGSLNRIKGKNEPGLGNNNPDQVGATIQTIKYLRDRSVDLIIQSGGGTQEP